MPQSPRSSPARVPMPPPSFPPSSPSRPSPCSAFRPTSPSCWCTCYLCAFAGASARGVPRSTRRHRTAAPASTRCCRVQASPAFRPRHAAHPLVPAAWERGGIAEQPELCPYAAFHARIATASAAGLPSGPRTVQAAPPPASALLPLRSLATAVASIFCSRTSPNSVHLLGQSSSSRPSARRGTRPAPPRCARVCSPALFAHACHERTSSR